MFKRFGSALLVLACICLPVGAQNLNPISVEDLIELKTPANRSLIDLSPDGRFVAYTLERPTHERVTDKRYFFYDRAGVPVEAIHSSLYITAVDSGETTQPIDDTHVSWGASWSPDGRYLAFYSDRGGQAKLWLWDQATRRARIVSRAIVRAFFGYEAPQWTPDSRKVLIKVLPARLTIEAAGKLLVAAPRKTKESQNGSSVIIYSSSADQNDAAKKNNAEFSLAQNRYLSDLALVDVTTGRAERVALNCFPVSYFLSPDGKYVAVTNIRRFEWETQATYYDLEVVSLADHQRRVLAPRVKMAYGRGVSWSPDGSSIFYVTSGPQTKGDCFLVAVGDGKTRTLTKDSHPNFGSNYGQPVWDASGRRLFLVGDRNLWSISTGDGSVAQLTKDLDRDVLEMIAANSFARSWAGSTALVITRDSRTKQMGLFSVDVATGSSNVMIENQISFGSPLSFTFDVSNNSSMLAFISQDAQHCPEVWVSDINLKAPRRITHNNPKLDKYQMGQARLVHWQSGNGELLNGALLLPSGYEPGRRYPLIVSVYGGSLQSNSLNQFGFGQRGVANAQALATRGYAVFMPDMPLRVGTPMQDVARTVMPGIDKVIEMGIADPERLGVTGGSYGGYCVLALMVQTNRFKAAIARSASADMIASYTQMQSDGSVSATGWAEEGQGRMGGTLWQYRERYIENSPLFYLDRVTTPLLLVSGAADEVVPPQLSDEIYVALKRLNKEVVYAKYQGGEHTEDSFDRTDTIDYFNRMIAWFDKYLKQ